MVIINKEIKVYRHELKYFINQNEYNYLRNIFNIVLEKDEFTSSSGDYWIRSLYFDTLDNKDYHDKMLGVKNRKKIRLRIYDVNTETVKLEIKNRYDQYMLKETITISKDDSIQLIHGNVDVLLKYSNTADIKSYYYIKSDYYKPKVIVDYEREAYICPINSIRITFDKNIRTSNQYNDLFNKDISTINIFNEPTIILEVKYNKVLPELIRNILSTGIGTRSSISKYCLSREKIG